MAYISNFITQSSTTGGTSYGLTLPPHVADDVIVICVSADGGVTLAISGWTQIGTTQVSGALLSAACFYKKATSSAETATVSMGTADAIHVHMFVLKDVDTSTQLDASAAAVYSATLNFNTPQIATNTADCLVLYYVARDDATTTPSASHSNPGPMHFLDSSDNGGSTVTSLAAGAAGWYIQRAAGTTPICNWDHSSSEIYADFVMAFRNKSGGLIPPYIDDSAALGTRLMTGTWWASASTRNNQNFKATPLTLPHNGVHLIVTATAGTGATATLTFAEQPAPPFAVGQSITVAGITPTGYNATAVAVTGCTTTTVSYANATTGAMTIPGHVGGTGTVFDAGAAVVDAGFNPYSSAVNSTPAATTITASGFELFFATTEIDMTTGWIVGGFQASTSKMALFNQGSIAQGGTFLTVCKSFNAITTTAATGTGSVATLTFAAQSIAIPVGTLVTVAGVTPTGYNGTYVVTASSTTTVSYANATTGAQTVAGTVTANQYRTYQVMGRDNQDGAGAGFAVISVQPSSTSTLYGYSRGDLLPLTKVNRLLWTHMGQNATGAFYYMDWHLMQRVIVAGGTASAPVDTQGLYDVGRYCRLPLVKKAGASGVVAYVPIQIGGGDAVNFQIDAGALQFPRNASIAQREVNFHSAAGAIGISYAGKSGDVIKHTNSVVTSPSRYSWSIHAAATSAATWDFTGLLIVNADVTLRNVMTFKLMTFSACASLNWSGCTVDLATVSGVPAASDTLTTSGTSVITNGSFDVRGVSAGNRWGSVTSPAIFTNCEFTGSASTGHALRLTTPGTYALTNNTWTGFGANGTTSAAIFNDSGGAVTLNVSGGTTPTVRNGTGATTQVNNNVTVTVTANVSLVGAEIRVYDLDNQPAGSLGTELAGVESHDAANYAFSVAASNVIWLQIMTTGYEEFGQQFTAPTTSGDLPITLKADINT